MRGILVIVFLFFQVFAQAETLFLPYGQYQKLDHPGEIIVKGKGIRAKHSNQSIGIICGDEKCTSLRYAIFDRENVYTFGEPLNPSEKGILLKRADPKLNTARSVLVLLGGTVGSIFLVPVTAVPLLTFLGIEVIGYLSEQGGNSHYFENLDVVGHVSKLVNRNKSATAEGKVFLDQNGWNWSVKPKKVSAFRYCQTIAAILNIPTQPRNGYYVTIQVGENSYASGYDAYVSTCMAHFN